MDCDLKLRARQNERLFDLLHLKAINKDVTVIGLDELIVRAKCSMTQESVAWVEKLIAEVYPQ